MASILSVELYRSRLACRDCLAEAKSYLAGPSATQLLLRSHEYLAWCALMILMTKRIMYDTMGKYVEATSSL